MFSFSPTIRSLSVASTSNSFTSVPVVVTWKVIGPAFAVFVETGHFVSESETAMASAVASALFGTQPVRATARAAAPAKDAVAAASGRSRGMGVLCFLGCGTVSGGDRSVRGGGRACPRGGRRAAGGAVLTDVEGADDDEVGGPGDHLQPGRLRVEVDDARGERAVPAG